VSTGSEHRLLRITGIVQGVGYRYSTVREALRLGLSGWVRNRRDGSVEANISGEAEAVAKMIAWCRQGPTGASVDHVAVEIGEACSGGFEQRPTV
jgi:acylphosphatase